MRKSTSFPEAAGGPAAVPPGCLPKGASRKRLRKCPVPDLSGLTVGTWRILYEEKMDGRGSCMCRCVRCGLRKIIRAFKFRQGYALRCPACRTRRILAGA